MRSERLPWYRRMVLLAEVDKRRQSFLDLFQFLCVLLVRIFQVLEGTGRIDVVARVDAHLLCMACGHVGHVGVEVDVCTKRLRVALCAQLAADVGQVLGLSPSLCGQAHQFASCVDDALALRHAPLGVEGRGCGHRLDAHRIVSTDVEPSHMGYGCGTPLIVEQICHFPKLYFR